MAASRPLQQLAITIPPNIPIGVSIQQQDKGGNQCVVTGYSYDANDNRTNPASPLAVGDVIVALNGIALDRVHGAMPAWVTLFRAFETMERQLVVLRTLPTETATSAATVPAGEKAGPPAAAPADAMVTRAMTATAPRTINREDAEQFLRRVQIAFGDRPHLYREFVDAMKDYQSQTLSTAGVMRRVAALLRGRERLLLGFNAFLPEGYRIELPRDGSAGPICREPGSAGAMALAPPEAAGAIVPAPKAAGALSTAIVPAGTTPRTERVVRDSTKNSAGRWSNLGRGQQNQQRPSAPAVQSQQPQLASNPPAEETERNPEGSTKREASAKKRKVGEEGNVAKNQPVPSAKKTDRALGGSSADGKTTSNSTKRGIEVISLLDDSSDEETSCKESGGEPPAVSGSVDRGLENGKMPAAAPTAASASDATEAASSSASSQWRQAKASSLSNGSDDEDGELQVVGTKGQNALADFPHARANCVTHPFAGSKPTHCANCYCYVCDIPAADCKQWAAHCEASHDSPFWRNEREKAKRQAREAASAPAPAAASSALTLSSSTSSSGSARPRRPELSVRKLLEKLTRVYPVEIAPPAGSGFTTELRHYQKQSLSFCVETERTSGRGGWLCDEVGMGKSAIVLALVAANKPSPKNLASKRRIQEGLSRMEANDRKRAEIQRLHDREMLRIDQLQQSLHSDSGMDERAKCNRWYELYMMRQSERLKMQSRISSEILPLDGGKLKVKPTVILTSVSLLGQWEDEAKKHCPGLVVKSFHGSRKKSASNAITLTRASIPGLNEIDIIISTATFRWPSDITDHVEFHRVVQDEAHLFNASASAKTAHANAISSPRRWGVTATPMINSVRDLSRQLDFIQAGSAPNAFSSLELAMTRYQSRPVESNFNNLVDVLQTFMVRHTKAQRIAGAEALSLPPSTTTTVMLNMSRNEDRAFNCISASRSLVSKHCANGAKKFVAERYFLHRYSSALRLGEPTPAQNLIDDRAGRYIPERLSKIVGLRQDLARLRSTEPHLRAVVYSQYVEIHAAACRGLQEDGFQVYQFTGSTNARQRDNAIRDFQNKASCKPAVFIITLKSGNVGITLTAASRVYLLEPCLDPAVEVQAAGRIHRLGQDKPCHVVKFAFNNSVESNIIKLHKKILAGKISIVDGFVPPKAMKILAKGLRHSE